MHRGGEEAGDYGCSPMYNSEFFKTVWTKIGRMCGYITCAKSYLSGQYGDDEQCEVTSAPGHTAKFRDLACVIRLFVNFLAIMIPPFVTFGLTRLEGKILLAYYPSKRNAFRHRFPDNLVHLSILFIRRYSLQNSDNRCGVSDAWHVCESFNNSKPPFCCCFVVLWMTRFVGVQARIQTQKESSIRICVALLQLALLLLCA